MSDSPFDKEAALEFVDGDLELFQIVVDQFREDCPSLLGELQAALSAADASTIQRVAHTLKGLAATFAAAPAATAAKAIEQMGRDGLIDDAKRAYPELQSQLDRLLPALTD